MGVKGLTTFVNQHQQFFENYQLHSTKLVIDGYGIMSQLYFKRTMDPGNHGGEFQKFYTHCAHFCQNLHNCGIRPYVVFDGAYDIDGKKCVTMKERLQQKIGSVRRINEGKHAFIMPAMANEVFKKVLRDFQVPFGFCDFEADRDIAVLANALRCPVLGQDSDFFIMDIKNGYIPFDRLKWSKPSSFSRKPKGGDSSQPQKKQNFIGCRRYKLTKFCSYFQVESCLMPLFASVCGNDYLQSISLSGFFGATKQLKPDGRPHPRHKGNNKFCEVLHHLTFYKTYRECLEVIVKQVPPPKRATTELALSASCDMYELFNESPIVKFFIGEDADLSTNLLVRDHGVPASFVRLLRQGEVPFMCLIIYLNRMYFLGAQVEKISEMRSSDCSHDLLRTLTGIMLVDAAKESQSKGKALKIDVYDRDNMHMKRFKVEPLCEIPLFGTVPSFRRISSTSKHQRRLLLLASLEAKDIIMDDIPELFQLVLVVTVYWFRHARPQVPQNLLVAMVLGWIQGVAWCQHNATLRPLANWAKAKGFNAIFLLPDYESVLHNFHDLATRPRQKFLNLDASHGLAQWVACFCMAEYINALLMHVFPRADMTVLFNGLLIHNLYHTLMRPRENPHEEWIDTLLPRNSPARCVFEQLMRFLSHHLGFQETFDQWVPIASQQGKRSHRGGGRGRGRGRGGRGPGASRGQRGRGGSNRNPRGGNT